MQICLRYHPKFIDVHFFYVLAKYVFIYQSTTAPKPSWREYYLTSLVICFSTTTLDHMNSFSVHDDVILFAMFHNPQTFLLFFSREPYSYKVFSAKSERKSYVWPNTVSDLGEIWRKNWFVGEISLFWESCENAITQILSIFFCFATGKIWSAFGHYFFYIMNDLWEKSTLYSWNILFVISLTLSIYICNLLISLLIESILFSAVTLVNSIKMHTNWTDFQNEMNDCFLYVLSC